MNVEYTTYDTETGVHNWAKTEVVFKVNDTSILPACRTEITVDDYESTLVNYL